MNRELKKIAKEIKKADKIALFTHISPDNDALGSTFALYYALTVMGKNVSIYSKDELSAIQKIIFDEKVIKKTVCKTNEYDLFIACDAPASFRLGYYEEVFTEKENSIVIDHHQNAGLKGKYNYIDSSRSSCCELVYDILKVLKVKVSSEIASKLYAGLSSDTSSFINSNTNYKSYLFALELVKKGAQIGLINETMYKNQTRKAIEFKKFLWNNYKIKGDCAFCLMSHQDLKDLKGKKSDCVGYSSSLISIQGINYSFSIVEEEEGLFSVSLRSKIGYDVRTIAEKLGGGGHFCAAGAKLLAKNIGEAKDVVLNALKEVQ